MAGGDGGSSSGGGRKRKQGDDVSAGASGTAPPPPTPPPSPPSSPSPPPSPPSSVPTRKRRSEKCPVDGCKRRRPDDQSMVRHLNRKHPEELRKGVKYPSIFSEEEATRLGEARRRKFLELYEGVAPVPAEAVAAAVEAGMVAAEAAAVVAEATSAPEEETNEAAAGRIEIPDLNRTPTPPEEDI